VGERCELPSEFWGEASAEIEFVASYAYLQNIRSGGNDFNQFS